MIYWEDAGDGDLMPRKTPLPVAVYRDVRDGVEHLEGVGTLAVPPAAGVLAGLRYGPDGEWVGTLAVGESVVPPGVDDGWGRLRVLLRGRLAGLAALLGEARGLSAFGTAGQAAPRALPAGDFDVAAGDGSRPAAGYYEATLRLRFYAATAAALDRLAEASVALLSGWTLTDEAWEARGFALASQVDAPAAGSGALDAAVTQRSMAFAFRAWRIRAEPDSEDEEEDPETEPGPSETES